MMLLTTPARRAALLEALSDAPLTYPEHGATSGTMPADATQLDRELPIGRGGRVFDRASEAVLGWRMHRGSGLHVIATTSRAEVGTIVVVTLVRGVPLGVSAPCRVVSVVDEPDRRGFTYGTLPGHPMSGEERFEVIRDPGGTARLRLVAFSRHAFGLAGRFPPIISYVQRIAAGRYAQAVRRAAAGR